MGICFSVGRGLHFKLRDALCGWCWFSKKSNEMEGEGIHGKPLYYEKPCMCRSIISLITLSAMETRQQKMQWGWGLKASGKRRGGGGGRQNLKKGEVGNISAGGGGGGVFEK